MAFSSAKLRLNLNQPRDHDKVKDKATNVVIKLATILEDAYVKYSTSIVCPKFVEVFDIYKNNPGSLTGSPYFLDLTTFQDAVKLGISAIANAGAVSDLDSFLKAAKEQKLLSDFCKDRVIGEELADGYCTVDFFAFARTTLSDAII